jgi:hypothetical protein
MGFTIVPAPNGLGHIVRMLELAKILSGNKSQVQIILPSYAGQFIQKLRIDPFIVIDYLNWESRNLTSGDDTLRYSELACSIATQEYLISDNLLEVLYFSKKVLLSANFLWSDQYNFSIKSPQYDPIALIKTSGVKIVCNKFFQSNTLRGIDTTIPVGFFMKDRILRRDHIGRSLLIAFGVSGRESKSEVEDVLLQISSGNYNAFDTVYLEPQLYDCFGVAERFSKLKRATFDREMFEHVTDAVIRPGLSTIQNLLSSGARVFPIKVAINDEIDFNASKLEEIGVGISLELSNFAKEVTRNGHITYSPELFFVPTIEVTNVFTNTENYTLLQ